MGLPKADVPIFVDFAHLRVGDLLEFTTISSTYRALVVELVYLDVMRLGEKLPATSLDGIRLLRVDMTGNTTLQWIPLTSSTRETTVTLLFPGRR